MDTEKQSSHKAHPQLKKIVGEVVMINGADAALPKARLLHWHAFLKTNYPRGDNPLLYGQLLTLAFAFGKYKATACYQLFALSSIGLSREQIEINAETAPFMAAEQRHGAAAALQSPKHRQRPRPGKPTQKT